jgi:hypothetical protein
MTTPSPLLRVRQAWAALLDPRADRYTEREVRMLLHPDASACDARCRAVRETAAVPGVWLARLDAHEAYQLGRLSEPLPTIVFLYARGVSADEIAARVGGWGPWGVEQALGVAARCIAAALNRGNGPTLGDAA